MKKLIVFLSALMITCSLTAFAAPVEYGVYSSQKLNYGMSFHKIVVEDDISLVIYENATTNIQFDGNKEDIAKIDWKIKKGILYIRSKQGSLKNKVIVTLDVSNLSAITINGSSSVRSLGDLHSPMLNVYIQGECFVSLRNNGGINVINAENREMDIQEKSGRIALL